jgi:hypothetical protein
MRCQLPLRIPFLCFLENPCQDFGGELPAHFPDLFNSWYSVGRFAPPTGNGQRVIFRCITGGVFVLHATALCEYFLKHGPEFAIFCTLIGPNEIHKVVSFGESVGSYLLTPIITHCSIPKPDPRKPTPSKQGFFSISPCSSTSEQRSASQKGIIRPALLPINRLFPNL